MPTLERDEVYDTITCQNSPAFQIDAVKLYRGIEKLCFFDAEDRLRAVFPWNTVLAVIAEGALDDQVIVEHSTFEKPDPSNEATEAEKRANGPVLFELEAIVATMKTAVSRVRDGWLVLHAHEEQTNSNAILREHHSGTLMSLEAQIRDAQDNLKCTLDLIFRSLSSITKGKKQ